MTGVEIPTGETDTMANISQDESETIDSGTMAVVNNISHDETGRIDGNGVDNPSVQIDIGEVEPHIDPAINANPEREPEPRTILERILNFFERPAPNQLNDVTQVQRVLTEAAASFIGFSLPCFLATLISRLHVPTWLFTWIIIPLCVRLTSIIQFIAVGGYVPETHGQSILTLSSLISPPPNFHRRQVPSYWFGQTLGTFAGVGFERTIFHHGPICPIICHISIYLCCLFEFIGSFLLTYGRGRILSYRILYLRRVLHMAWLVSVLSFGGGHISGPALTPIRFLAPAVVSLPYHQMLKYMLVFFLCSTTGGTLGGIANNLHGGIPDLSPQAQPQEAQPQAQPQEHHREEEPAPPPLQPPPPASFPSDPD